ncbi:MAG: YtxH domain-containing protein [Cyanobacteria bacterium P01_H01_bin.74]
MSNATEKLLSGMLVGGLLGVVIGMLLAPRAGKETRAMMQEEMGKRYDDSTKKLKETAETVQKTVKEETSKMGSKLSDLSGKLETAGRETLERFKQKKNENEKEEVAAGTVVDL